MSERLSEIMPDYRPYLRGDTVPAAPAPEAAGETDCDVCGKPLFEHTGPERFCPAYATYRNTLRATLAALSQENETLRADKAPSRHDQTPDGCWVACIAGVTGLPHDELASLIPRLPDGRVDGSMGTEYRNAINAYLRSHGWRLDTLGPDVPAGYAIGSGTSPRGLEHSCIVLDGALWHDPHPSRAGVAAFTEYEVAVRLARPVVTAWDDVLRFCDSESRPWYEARRAARAPEPAP